MNEPKVITLADFKTLVTAGKQPPRDALIRKAFTCDEIKAVAADDRAIQLSISNESVDRDSDTLNVQGWKLVNYRRNPVVLWAHDYRQLPVGRADKVFTEDQKLKVIDHFVEREINPFADTVLLMLKHKYLNAASVGFIPIKYERVDPEAEDGRGRRGGIDFKQQELLEHSIVPVPSNPEALVEARSVLKRADWNAYLDEIGRLLDLAHGEQMIVIPRSQLEQAWKLVSGKTVVSRDPFPPAIAPSDPGAGTPAPQLPAGGAPDDDPGGGQSHDVAAGEEKLEMDVPLYNAAIAHYNGIREMHTHMAAHLRQLSDASPEKGRRRRKDDTSDVSGHDPVLIGHLYDYHTDAAQVAWQVMVDLQAAVAAGNAGGSASNADPGAAEPVEGRSAKGDHPEPAAKHDKPLIRAMRDHHKAMAGHHDDMTDTCRGMLDGSKEPEDVFTADVDDDDVSDVVKALEEKQYVIQTLVCPKKHWNSAGDAKKWLEAHNFKTEKVDETPSAWRFRQRPPGDFKRIRPVCINPGKDTAPNIDKCKVLAFGGPLKAVRDAGEGIIRDFDGEDRVLAAVSDMRDELAAVRQAMGSSEARGVIGYKHTPLAPQSAPWDAGKEVAAASVDDLRVMCTWYGGDGTKKGDYKLPHHHAHGHACVWRGVAAAAGRLAGTSLPAADVPGVKKHLAGHYKDFGKEAPWKAAPEEWEAFELSARAHTKLRDGELTDAEMASLLEVAGFQEEADAVRETVTEDEIDAAYRALGLEPTEVEGVVVHDFGDGLVLDDDELHTMLHDTMPIAIGEATKQVLAQARGRLPD
jgi:HK97 family phage prohead protease